MAMKRETEFQDRRTFPNRRSLGTRAKKWLNGLNKDSSKLYVGDGGGSVALALKGPDGKFYETKGSGERHANRLFNTDRLKVYMGIEAKPYR
jgi:hypothetical protein